MNAKDVDWDQGSEPGFRGSLLEFGMGQLKYMFHIISTKQMILYYGANRAKRYKQAIYDQMVSRKVRGIECEVWE